MKTPVFFHLVLFSAFAAFGQQREIQTTPYSRTILKAADAASARSALGIVASNQTVTLTPDNNTLKTNASGQLYTTNSPQLGGKPAAAWLEKTNSTAEALTVNNGTNNNGTFNGSTNTSYEYYTNLTDRVFNLKAFGAKCDRIQTTANVTSNSLVLSGAPSGTFSAFDLGKAIVVVGGGLTNDGSGAHYDFATTIAGFTNSTSVGLADAPSNTITGGVIWCGTDDRSALNAAWNAAASNQFSATIRVPAPGSMIGSGFQDDGISTNHHKAAIVCPPVKSFYGYPTITFEGVSRPSGQYLGRGMLGPGFTWCYTQPNNSPTNTPRFFSMADGWTVASLRTPRRYAGPQYVRIVVKNLSFVFPFDNDADGLDLYSALQANVENCSFTSTIGTSGGNVYNPRSTNGIPLIMPFEASFNEHTIKNCAFYGTYWGFSAVGALDCQAPTFYSVRNAVTALNAPKFVSIQAPIFMECSNCVYLAAGVSMVAAIKDTMQINSAAHPLWQTNGVDNHFIVTEDGGANIDWSGFGYYSPGLTTNLPSIVNTTIAAGKRTYGHTLTSDTGAFEAGDRIFVDSVRFEKDVSTSRILYGRPALFDFGPRYVFETNNGTTTISPVFFGTSLGTIGYPLTTSYWHRVHSEMKPLDPALTNRTYETMRFTVMMTNEGVTCWQAGYVLFSTNAELASRSSGTIYATNPAAGDKLITLEWQDHFTVPEAARQVKPFLLWGGAGAGLAFNNTNHAAFVNGQFFFSRTAANND